MYALIINNISTAPNFMLFCANPRKQQYWNCNSFEYSVLAFFCEKLSHVPRINKFNVISSLFKHTSAYLISYIRTYLAFASICIVICANILQ